MNQLIKDLRDKAEKASKEIDLVNDQLYFEPKALTESFKIIRRFQRTLSPKDVLRLLDAMDKMRGALELASKLKSAEEEFRMCLDENGIDEEERECLNFVTKVRKTTRQTLKEVFGDE